MEPSWPRQGEDEQRRLGSSHGGINAPGITPISVSHPELCGVSGQPQPGTAGPGAQGPHLVLAVQGSLEVTEDLGAGDAAAGSCGQGQRLSAAPRGTRAGQGWHCPHSPARCSAVRPLPSATSTGQEAWGKTLGHGRRGTEGQTARVALWTVKGQGTDRLRGVVKDGDRRTNPLWLHTVVKDKGQTPCGSLVPGSSTQGWEAPGQGSAEGRGSKDREDTALAQHRPPSLCPSSLSLYLQQFADTLRVAVLGGQVQGSVTWEGTNRSQHGQRGCARGDSLGTHRDTGTQQDLQEQG